jgi:hypothetical protein
MQDTRDIHDVYGLSDAGDSDRLGLTDEDVEPSGDTEGIGEVIGLLETKVSGSLDVVPAAK